MKSYFGTYNASGIPSVECTVLVFDKSMSIGYKAQDGSNVMLNWPLRDVESSFDMARQSSRFSNRTLPGQLVTEGRDAFDFIQQMQAEQRKPWHKKSSGRQWVRNSVLLAGIAGILVVLYLLLVPLISQSFASKVSAKTERQLGDAVYDAMELASMEDTAASFYVNEFFSEMGVPSVYDIRITVVNDNIVNAFALPGGRIVVYKPLLQKLESYPELAALLSHEFTHINNKHSTKSIFRRLGSKVFLGLLFGRFGTVTSILVNHADNLKNLKYSRKLEREADMDGLTLLKERNIDPAGFTELFRHLQESGTSSSVPEFLASHPDIEKRILYIREASAGTEVKDNEQLKAIFDKIKQNK